MQGAKSRVRLDAADPINRDLLGFWPLDDGAGSIARDISPYRSNAITYAAGSVAPLGRPSGPFGKTTAFVTGSPPTRALIGTPGQLVGVQAPLTIAAWIKPTGTSGTQTILGQYAGTTGSRLLKLLRLDGSALRYYTSVIGGGFQFSSTHTVTASVWSFVGISVDAALNYTLYLNRTSVSGSFAGLSGTPDLTTPIMIGDAASGFNEGFDGQIYGVRALGRAIRPAEWARLYGDPWAGTSRRLRNVPYVPSSGPLSAEIAGTVDVTAALAATNALAAAIDGTVDVTGSIAATNALAAVLADTVDVTASLAVITDASAVIDGTVPITAEFTVISGASTGDTHDGFKKRSRRERRIEALRQRADDERVADTQALRVALEEALGGAKAIPAEKVAEAAERAPKPAEVDWRAVAQDDDQYEKLSRAVARLASLVEAEAKRRADDDDDEDAAFLMGIA